MRTEHVIVDLADRHGNGLDLVLIWARHSGRLWVKVTHRSTGRIPQIEAAPGQALDAFKHPFAYTRPVAR
jgi:hypothetical protein